MSNRMKKLIAALVLIAGGAIFILLGAASIKEIREFRQIPAVVSRIEREWTPNGDGTDTENATVYVTYTVDGREYTEKLQNTQANCKQGATITVLYNPKDPTEVSGATKTLAVIQFAAGGALVLAGAGVFIFKFLGGRKTDMKGM